jgi:E3 ubiquitin-protein ligase SHPRH
MELLLAKHPGIPPTLRDGRLEEEVIAVSFHSAYKCVFFKLYALYS